MRRVRPSSVLPVLGNATTCVVLLFIVVSLAATETSFPQAPNLNPQARLSRERAAQKAPVPSAAAQEEAMKIIREVYWEEYKKATSDLAKQRFARKLIQKAEEGKGDLAGRFCLLKVAKESAIQGGDIGTALEALERMSESFQIDFLKMKMDLVTEAANKAPSEKDPRRSAQLHGRIVDEAMDLLDAAASVDDFPSARIAGKLALDAAKNASDESLVKQTSERIEAMERLAKAYAEVEKAVAVLQKTPADPGANLALGKYLCFTRGKWDKGLPLLARGSDGALKVLAQKELDPDLQLIERVPIGDAWWDLSLKADETTRRAFQARAAYWYRAAVNDLTGLTKDKVEKRLRQLEPLKVAKKAEPFVVARPFDGRKSAETRNAMLRRGGGNTQTEQSVESALDWLARHQNRDGSWTQEGYRTRCADQSCTGAGGAKQDVGTTALGLLPFLAAGQTHKSKGPYQARIAAAVNWLIQQQKTDGDLRGHNGTMYSHGLATMAVCEAYGLSGDKKIAAAAQRGINFIQAAQHNEGGWRYNPRDAGDTSVVGWQVMALKSGQMAGLSVNPACLEGAKKFLDSVASGYHKEQFSYQPKGGATECMTAVGLLCSQYLGAKRNDPQIVDGGNYLVNHLPDADKNRNVYYWYYATQVMHNLTGPQWATWNRQQRKTLINSQAKGGCAAGSWDPAVPAADQWGNQGGRIMVTSLSTLTLQVYYRYPPLYAGQE